MTLLQRVADHGQLMTGQPVSLPNQEVFFCLSLWEIRPVEMRHSERRWFPYLSRGKQYAMAIAFLVFLSLPAAARILSYLSNMYWEKSLTIPSMNTFSGKRSSNSRTILDPHLSPKIYISWHAQWTGSLPCDGTLSKPEQIWKCVN